MFACCGPADLGAIPVVMVLEMDFPDLGAIRASLASDIKTEAHETTLQVLKPCSGRFFHFITESRSLDAGTKLADMADHPLSIDIRNPLLLKANDFVLLTQENQ